MPNLRLRRTVTGAFDREETRVIQTRTGCAAAWTFPTPLKSYTGMITDHSIEDREIPGFHYFKRCGGFLPYNPVIIKTIETKRIAGNGPFRLMNSADTCYIRQYDGPYWEMKSVTLTKPPLEPEIALAVYRAAESQLKASVFDALTFAAELNKTKEMVANRSNAIWQFARNALKATRRYFALLRQRKIFSKEKWEYLSARRKRALKSRKNRGDSPLEVFNSFWLELRYGWMPVVHDVNNAVKAFYDKVKTSQIVNGSSSQQVNFSLSNEREFDHAQGRADCFETLVGSYTVRGKAYGRVTAVGLKRWTGDPIATLWEIVPYSFVVDWFVDVGSYLDNISPFKGVDLLGGGYSVRTSYLYRQRIDYTYFENHGSGNLSDIRTEERHEYYERVPIGTSLPGWNPRLTALRTIDLTALVTQRGLAILKELNQVRR